MSVDKQSSVSVYRQVLFTVIISENLLISMLHVKFGELHLTRTCRNSSVVGSGYCSTCAYLSTSVVPTNGYCAIRLQNRNNRRIWFHMDGCIHILRCTYVISKQFWKPSKRIDWPIHAVVFLHFSFSPTDIFPSNLDPRD